MLCGLQLCIDLEIGAFEMEMASVYLKGGKNIEVPLEELADYLHNNADKIETRKKQVRRPPTQEAFEGSV